MRKFKLWNNAESSSINLSGDSIMTTDVTGLGSSFNINTKETEGRKYVIDSFQSFEDITFQVYFGIINNAYVDYKALADFVIANGSLNFVLEYSFNGLTRYCDVRVKRLPKTQKDHTSTMNHTVVLERLTPWYEKVSVTFTNASSTTSFSYDHSLSNIHSLPLQIKFLMSGSSGANIFIYLKNVAGTVTYNTISLPLSGIPVSLTISIDSENKKVTRTIGGTTTNGYESISRVYDSFMLINQGSWRLDVPVLPLGTTVISYKKWVID